MEAQDLAFNLDDTQRLLPQVRQRFLDFLESFEINEEEESRSQFTQNSDQVSLTQSSKPYVEQVSTFQGLLDQPCLATGLI